MPKTGPMADDGPIDYGLILAPSRELVGPSQGFAPRAGSSKASKPSEPEDRLESAQP